MPLEDSFPEIEELARLPMKSESEMGMVEIIVLKYKAPEVEVECVRRIIEHTDWPYKLVVYDNRQNTANTSKIWNKLIRDSTCEYVMFIDSDAFAPPLRPCWLTRMMSTFRQFPGCQVVIPVSNRVGGERQQRPPEDKPPEEYRGIFSGFCFLFRKSVLATAGWFDEEFYFYGADSVWAARLLNTPGQVYLLPDVHVEHVAAHSLSKAERDERLDGAAERRRAAALYHLKTASLTGGQNGGASLPPEPAFRAIEELVRLPMKTESEMGMVEIVVLKYKAPEVEVECVRRIIEHTDWPYKLVVYDNRQNTANTSKIWNKLIRDSTCEYVMLIDSDAFAPRLTPCWLTRMMSTFQQFPGCQVVIPVSNRAGGDFQQRPPEDKPPEEYRAQFSSVCFLFRKSALGTVGWFDEEYYFYGADGEWSARFLRRPGEVCLRPDVWVEHLGCYSRQKAEVEERFDAAKESARAAALTQLKTAWVKTENIGIYSRPAVPPPANRLPLAPAPSLCLNLGCGRDYREGWINCDASPEVKADVYFDIREEIPFPDGSAGEIHLGGVLTQIVSNEEFRTAMNECWRVLKEDGQLRIVVPCARYAVAFRDPFDSRRFTEETWEYLIEGAYWYEQRGRVYGFKPWTRESVRTDDSGMMTVVLRKPRARLAAGPRARPAPVRAPTHLRVAVVGSTHPSYELACPHWNGIRRGLEKLALPYRFLTSRTASAFNANLCAELEEFKPDLIVYGLIDLIRQPESRMRIREKFPRATVVVWYCDLRNDDTGQVEADCRDTVDAMLVTNGGQREFYQRKFNLDRVYFLPQACEPIDAPRIADGLGFDFVFIGVKNFTGPFASRAKLVESLQQKHGLIQIDGEAPALREKVYRAMPEIYSSSKVCLDISHFWNIPQYCSIRYWEVPAFFGFALSRRFPGCEEFYQDKVHRVYFDSLEECIDLKDYYQAHEGERERIRRAGWENSHRHTYRERFLEMFRILGL